MAIAATSTAQDMHGKQVGHALTQEHRIRTMLLDIAAIMVKYISEFRGMYPIRQKAEDRIAGAVSPAGKIKHPSQAARPAIRRFAK
jgi:hypothetical protein